MSDMRLANGRRYFEYHCYEGEDSADAILWHHTHQQVEVVSKYADMDEYETGRLYKVRFTDGLEYDVWNDELMRSQQDYYRPDYIK